jgi:hypothetical protein
MAAILTRTVFYDQDAQGRYRFHDWAMVNTNVGMMLEPRVVLNPAVMPGLSMADRDYGDECQRIDRIVPWPADKPHHYLSDEALCGGNLIGRVGR